MRDSCLTPPAARRPVTTRSACRQPGQTGEQGARDVQGQPAPCHHRSRFWRGETTEGCVQCPRRSGRTNSRARGQASCGPQGCRRTPTQARLLCREGAVPQTVRERGSLRELRSAQRDERWIPFLSLPSCWRSQRDFIAFQSASDKCGHVLRAGPPVTHSSSLRQRISAFRKEASFTDTTHQAAPELTEPATHRWLQTSLAEERECHQLGKGRLALQ